MSDQSPFSSQTSTIRTNWEAIKTVLRENPAILEQAAPGVSIEQMDEVLDTMCNWASRMRSPNGFKPVFPFARVQFATVMNSLVTLSANAVSNTAATLPAFLTQITNCFVPLSCATMFAEKDDRIRGAMEAHAELEQHIALMNTAQHELGQKHARLESAQAVADDIDNKAAKVTATVQSIEAAKAKVDSLQAEAAEQLETITEAEGAATELRENSEKLLGENKTLATGLEKQRADFEAFISKANDDVKALQDKCTKQQQLIDSLLSGATSSALATAFGRGKRRYVISQWIWGLGFVASVGALAWMGVTFEKTVTAGGGASDVWIYLVHRLPLAAPMIWLGWFCSMQFGNVIRLMEDYAFKEATSIAFAGYRDHMEHLSGVSDGEAHTAMERLALVTISVLGNEPLRLLQKQHQDASPMDRLLSSFAALKGNKESNESEKKEDTKA